MIVIATTVIVTAVIVTAMPTEQLDGRPVTFDQLRAGRFKIRIWSLRFPKPLDSVRKPRGEFAVQGWAERSEPLITPAG
jgi:hypothetical protein